MGSPSIILTSQFTTPKAQSFTNYVNYMTRQEALLEQEKALSLKEQEELNKIKQAIDQFDMERGNTSFSGNKTNANDFSDKEKEAKTLLKTNDFFANNNDFVKYISYMSRQYALEKKKNRTVEEDKELGVVKGKASDFISTLDENKDALTDEIKSGVFSINKEKMTLKDIEDVNKIIQKAQKNGSVFYQDVISFDTDFLIKEKLYNPETNDLDEKKIQYASRKMMDKMFQDEDIQSGYWFASIHRNTEHIHIHYGTVEMKNTRPLVTVEEGGEKYVAPKGKRKQRTIDNMKSTFANSLIDRTAELSRISQLRNTLVHDMKEIYSDKEQLKQKKMIEELYKELPSNKKYWQYGSKHLSDDTRDKIDVITESLMKDNPHYQEYISKTEEESNYRKDLFGESEREEKDYANNKKRDIQKRLGNSLLSEMKDNVQILERNRNAYKEANNFNKNEDKSKRDKGGESVYLDKKYQKPLINKRNIYQMKRALNDDYKKYLAERDFEQMQQRIAWEQQQNRL